MTEFLHFALGLKIKWVWAIVCVLWLLTGCKVTGPEYRQPAIQVSDSWSAPLEQGLHTGDVTLAGWWQVFEDPVLDQLVALAREQNLLLEVAAVRVLESRAQLALATGLKYPQMQVLGGDASWVSPAQSDILDLLNVDNFWQFSFGASVSWELDFWGKYRNARTAANAAYLASEAAYDQALAILTAQTVNTYIIIRETEEQLRISHDNVSLQEKSYHIAEVLYRNGQDSELDMQQAETLLLSTKATIPALQASLRQARNALDLLLGQLPGTAEALLAGAAGIPKLPGTISVGFPADMLRQRPDVKQAELMAMAQNAQVGMAAAALYPSFSLTGSIGLSAGGPGDSNFGDLFSSDALGYSLGGNFIWPFLNYGRIRNNIRVEDAVLQQALLNYQNVVLVAAREAEDAMAGYIGTRQQAAILAQSVYAAKRSNELSTLRYREGFSDYQRVLDAQQKLFSQQQRHVSALAGSARSLVTLNQALGAGWQGRENRPQVDKATLDSMRQRTNWGELLDDYPDSSQSDTP